MRYSLKLASLTAILSLVLILLVITDAYVHNFDVVINQQVYRSRELSKAQFQQVIAQYKIKTIVNLRGYNPDKTWYQQEIAAVKTQPVKHFDIALKSKVLPTQQQLHQLVTILSDSPRPLLIHCQSGVDRTGLAAMISLILANASMADIEKQVSWHYFVSSKHSVGLQLLALYKNWLKQKGLSTSRENFLRWLKSY